MSSHCYLRCQDGSCFNFSTGYSNVPSHKMDTGEFLCSECMKKRIEECESAPPRPNEVRCVCGQPYIHPLHHIAKDSFFKNQHKFKQVEVTL